MPIITLQQRLVQRGTIRIGAQVATSSGKTRPSALDKFRFTSDNRELLERLAVTYGGTVGPFAEPKSMDTWELFSDTDVIEVLVPPPGPGRSVISQFYEQWTAGGCTTRCDGAEVFKLNGRDMPPGTPCACAEKGIDSTDDAHCAAHTRLSVVLPASGVIGVWRLNTQGWNAAEELAGIAEVVLNRATALGYSVPCTLSIQRRESKKLVDGQPTTRKYVVPILDPDLPEDVLRRVTAGVPYDPRVGAGAPVDALPTPQRPELAAGVTADRYGTGRVKPKPIDEAVPATGLPLPSGPSRSAKAGLAYIRSLPESFQGDDAHDLRNALYALATNTWGATFGDLDNHAKAQVGTWATKVAAGDLTLNVGESWHSLTGPDGDAVSVTKP